MKNLDINFFELLNSDLSGIEIVKTERTMPVFAQDKIYITHHQNDHVLPRCYGNLYRPHLIIVLPENSGKKRRFRVPNRNYSGGKNNPGYYYQSLDLNIAIEIHPINLVQNETGFGVYRDYNYIELIKIIESLKSHYKSDCWISYSTYFRLSKKNWYFKNWAEKNTAIKST